LLLYFSSSNYSHCYDFLPLLIVPIAQAQCYAATPLQLINTNRFLVLSFIWAFNWQLFSEVQLSSSLYCYSNVTENHYL
jgi:hypothetical protein